MLGGLDGSPGWRVARVLAVVAVTALAIWFTRRGGRVGQGTTALLLGIAGTAAGAGIASAHLAKADLDAAAVLAAIVLVSGLFLLGWGAVALVRAIPGWWRQLAVPVAPALLQFVLLPLTVAVSAINRPPGPLGAVTPGYSSRCSSGPQRLACQEVPAAVIAISSQLVAEPSHCSSFALCR